MVLLTDQQEKLPLDFPRMDGVTYRTCHLSVGDYGAIHEKTGRDPAIVERKSKPDFFTAFTSRYTQERNKIIRAKQDYATYIVAVECTFGEVLEGHSYWNGKRQVEYPKSGLAMIKQICTVSRKYGIHVWFCKNRDEMAMRIQEYFLAQERVT